MSSEKSSQAKDSRLLTSKHIGHWGRADEDPDRFPSWEISARLSVVERVFELSRLSIPKFQADALSAAYADLARHAEIYERSDVQDRRKQLSAEIRETIPTAFNSMSIFCLSAAYEQSLKHLARYITRRTSLGDVKLRKAESKPMAFLREQVGDRVDERGETQIALTRLKLVRNAFAHGGGDVYMESSARRQELLEIVEADVGVSLERSQLVPSERFLLQSLSAVVMHLNQVMQAICDAFPMRPNPAKGLAP